RCLFRLPSPAPARQRGFLFRSCNVLRSFGVCIFLQPLQDVAAQITDTAANLLERRSVAVDAGDFEELFGVTHPRRDRWRVEQIIGPADRRGGNKLVGLLLYLGVFSLHY